MDSVRDTLAGGLPHSEISGSSLVCQLPGAFRRLPRLSSPVVAKASTACAWSLDSPTPTLAGSRVGLRRVRDAALARPIFRSRASSLHRTFHFVKERDCGRRRSRGPAHHRRRADTAARQTPDPRSGALRYRVEAGRLVEPGGFEPPTPGLQSRRSPG